MSQKPDWLAPHGRPWTRGEVRCVYDNPWIRVTEETALAPTGQPALYGVVSFKNRALAVLPLHDDGSVVLVGQQRLPLGDYSWEIPEGGGPMAEDPLDGAKRELLEETGLAASEWREVLRMQLSNSVTDEVAVGFLALGLAQAAEPEGDGTEDLAVVRVPFREALDAAMAGHIQDSLTVAMLLRGYHMAREGLLPDALARGMIG
ncbi:MAG: NUDIX domain-containing protein [Phenylobacterium sp.]|jgi:8-oxo-dGDP phosphatase|uniref:NUDIX domain-containing protein n=1 Tax=Phenylobacterium sp. TaxID=1871053 RepID=UPI00391A1DAD